VPRAKLACRRVGGDGDEMAAQLSRPASKLMSGPAARVGRQLVCLHCVGNRFPTRRGEDVRVSGVAPHASVGVRGSSRETETSRVRRKVVVRGRDFSEGVPLVGNWSGTGHLASEGFDRGPGSSSS
jgi:hypothetical protein